MTRVEQGVTKTALSPNRLEALTDGVFAIVMTLLVLGLGVPLLGGNSEHLELTQLIRMWPKFASYIVTFLMLGYMWSVHQRQFSLIKRSDSVLLLINIIFLMFTALLPFSTSLLGDYTGQQLPIQIYGGNFIACMLFGYIKWSYASGKYRLVDINIDPHEVRFRKVSLLVGMAFFAIGIGVSYLNITASICVITLFLISATIYSTLRYRIRITE